jgi:alpha-L-fucosidase 2
MSHPTGPGRRSSGPIQRHWIGITAALIAFGLAGSRPVIRASAQPVLAKPGSNGSLPAGEVSAASDRILRYDKPAQNWNEALPIGSGRLGAMIFGGVPRERIQFNEDTLWGGGPHDYSHPGAAESLPEIRNLLFAGKPREAEKLAMERFMSLPLGQMAYQPFGDILLEFPGHEAYTDFERSLDIGQALSAVRYKVGGTIFTREVFASAPDRVIAIRLAADKKKKLAFTVRLDSPHAAKSLETGGSSQTLSVAVKDGVLKGTARILVESDGEVRAAGDKIEVTGAGQATIYLAAATNFVSYKDVGGDPAARVRADLVKIPWTSFRQIRARHIADYRSLFDRFDIGFGSNDREALTTDRRLGMFPDSPDDPGLVALYVQYGRYLMISCSRPGSQPANLQGLWNQELDPPWGSKYTTNINAEMNYWPAETTNLGDCHEPFFRLVEECAQTGQAAAKAHYGAEGWVLHHNTDIWRGTAPINHANHGIWQGGSGWVSRHLWEHYLFTQDVDFLRGRAWPVMREAARFYAAVLTPDPKTGRLISVPSNSPEIGGLVAGPTMDHQIIRSLFEACLEASTILGEDKEFADKLARLIPLIAPNQIGRLGQLQEWLEDVDDPNEHHRHVSHLWGVHPGADITWEKSPEMMKAARQSLLIRGDEGTGWSLAWKINLWARFLDGDRAYSLLRLLFRVRDEAGGGGGGGSYLNLFDSHPPFQIDGNFGAAAGIVETLVQSHQGFIDVLPALPKALPSGFLRGVRARGGFELDLAWKDGQPVRVSVLSLAGKPCRIRVNGEMREFPTEKGKRYELSS